MNILRNFEILKKGLELDSVSLKSTDYKIDLTIDNKTIGQYKEFDNYIVGLYKSSKYQISMLIDNQSYPVDNKLIIEFEIKNEISNFVVKYDNEYILNVSYQTQIPVSTLWYTEEIEDVDFGQWIYNLLKSEERKSIFLKTNYTIK